VGARLRYASLLPLKTLLAMREPTNLLEYLTRRAYKLHDFMHVVLGADASVLGEVRIVSYTIGQTRDLGARAPAMALAGVEDWLEKPAGEVRQAMLAG